MSYQAPYAMQNYECGVGYKVAGDILCTLQHHDKLWRQIFFCVCRPKTKLIDTSNSWFKVIAYLSDTVAQLIENILNDKILFQKNFLTACIWCLYDDCKAQNCSRFYTSF